MEMIRYLMLLRFCLWNLLGTLPKEAVIRTNSIFSGRKLYWDQQQAVLYLLWRNFLCHTAKLRSMGYWEWSKTRLPSQCCMDNERLVPIDQQCSIWKYECYIIYNYCGLLCITRQHMGPDVHMAQHTPRHRFIQGSQKHMRYSILLCGPILKN